MRIPQTLRNVRSVRSVGLATNLVSFLYDYKIEQDEKRKIKMLDDYISGKTMPAFVKQSRGK